MASRIIEWYVKATRGDTSVRLAAPEGEAEANAMAGHLRRFGWGDVEVEDRTLPPLPEPEPAREKHHGPWPLCERCDGKHSPFDHEAEGCSHCMAICQKAESKPEAPSGFKHCMSFDEFTKWLGMAL